jgi:hypothetical protein
MKIINLILFISIIEILFEKNLTWQHCVVLRATTEASVDALYSE